MFLCYRDSCILVLKTKRSVIVTTPMAHTAMLATVTLYALVMVIRSVEDFGLCLSTLLVSAHFPPFKSVMKSKLEFVQLFNKESANFGLFCN